MRVVVIWCALLVLAVCNGAFREFVLVPWVGTSAAHMRGLFGTTSANP